MKELLKLTILEDDNGDKVVGVESADDITKEEALALLEEFVLNTALQFIDGDLNVVGENDSEEVQ